MIPTREQIERVLGHSTWTNGDQHLAMSWLIAIRKEVDYSNSVSTEIQTRLLKAVRANQQLRESLIAIGTDVGASVNESCTVDFLCEVKDEVKSVVAKLRDEIDRLKAELKAAREDGAEDCDRADANANTMAKLQADLDRANTEAALARDAMAKATTDTCAKVQNELRSVERALCSADVLIKYAEWPRGAYECHVKNTIETAIDALRDDSATTPYSPPFEGDPKDCAFKASDPVREEEIKAWRDWALGDIADPDLYDDCFVLSRAEIDAAVALMRRADGKALLRELRAWIIDEKWCAPGIVRKIDEMLAQPAPVEQPAPPAAAVPDDIGLGPVTDEMVQSGIAAVKDGRWITLEQLRKELAPAPDDTRELVAQLADVAAAFFVAPWGDRARAIAEKLRGGA